MKRKNNMNKAITMGLTGLMALASINMLPKNIIKAEATTTAPKVIQVAAGSQHTLFFMNDGTVRSEGWNDFGQLGIGNIQNINGGWRQISNLIGLKQMFTGERNSFFLMEGGTVKVTGDNGSGQLGLGDTLNRNSPVTIPNLAGVKQIAAGYAQAVFLMEDGTVKASGSNYNGELGFSDKVKRLVPTTIPNLTGVKQIAAGYGHTLFLMEDGTVKATGLNNYGQLGLGYTANKYIPTTIPNLTGVKQIAAGYNHSLFLMEDGTVKATGYNRYGQLGLGNTVDNYIPTTIPNLTVVKQIAAGYGHTEFLMDDGTVKAAGKNDRGQLGFGDQKNRYVPTTIPNVSEVKQVITGDDYAIFLMGNGDIKSSGCNFYGALGLGYAGYDVYSPTTMTSFHCDPDNLVNPLAGGSQAQEQMTNATNAVNAANDLIKDLSSQNNINAANTKIAEVQKLIDALPDGTNKTALQQQLDAVKTAVQLAQQILDASNKVIEVENIATDLSTQAKIDNAQSLLDAAEQLVTALPDGTVKTALQGRLDAVQTKIYEGQAVLDVVKAEAGTTDLTSYDKIATAQADKDSALNYVNNKLVDGTVKSDLTARLDAVQLKVNIAAATLKTSDAENSITQTAVDEANKAINILPAGDVKDALQDRVNFVKAVIDASNTVNNAKNTLDEFNTSLAASDLFVKEHKNQKSLIDSLQAQLDILTAQYGEVSTQVNVLQSTDKTALAARINELKNTLNTITGTEDSIQQIINELSKNPRHAKGHNAQTTLDAHYNKHNDATRIELKAKGLSKDEKIFTVDGNTIDAASIFKEDIEATIGTGNYHFISIDQDTAVVDQNGIVTPVKDGVAKITVYNEKGIVNIYLQLSGVPKAAK